MGKQRRNSRPATAAELYPYIRDDDPVGRRKAEDLIRARANAVAADQIDQLRRFNESEYNAREYFIRPRRDKYDELMLARRRRRR